MAANKASKDDQYVESLLQILKESSYTYIRLEQLSEDTSATVEADSEGSEGAAACHSKFAVLYYSSMVCVVAADGV